MPIANYTPGAPSGIVPNVAKISAPEYKGVVVDTKLTPLTSLITYVQGASWRIDYYSQVVNRDNDVRSQDTGQNSIYQQYIQIRNFDVKVTNPLTQSQNQDDKRTVVTGTSIIYSSVIPNKGDMFCADVGDGREGIFVVKNTDKKSYLTQTVYSIDYELVSYTDADLNRKKDLDDKSIKTLFFVKDFALNGQNPLLVEQDYQAVTQLEIIYHELINNYFTWFYNKEKKTLLVPGQPFMTYDAYASNAILSIVNTSEVECVKYIKRINTEREVFLHQPQFWDAMIAVDPSLIDIGNVKMGLVNTRSFNSNAAMEGIAYSGIPHLVYPREPDTSIVNSLKSIPLIPLNDVIVEPANRPNFVPVALADMTVTIGSDIVTCIYPVKHDDYYVLSESFYKDTATKSLLEIMTRAYLNKEDFSATHLFNLCKQYKSWGLLEKYYYIPIVLILIKSIIRNK